jgi:hypothetical protein
LQLCARVSPAIPLFSMRWSYCGRWNCGRVQRLKVQIDETFQVKSLDFTAICRIL